MPQTWMKLSDAASSLNVSTRTVERRIKRGELQTRLTNDGREVLVEKPDTVADITSDALSVIERAGEQQNELAQRIAAAYEHPLRRAEADATQSRRSARRAWIVTAGVSVILSGVMVGGVYVLMSLDQTRNRADDRTKAIAEQFADLQDRHQQATDTLSDTRLKLEAAHDEQLALARQLAEANARLAETADRPTLTGVLARYLAPTIQDPDTGTP